MVSVKVEEFSGQKQMRGPVEHFLSASYLMQSVINQVKNIRCPIIENINKQFPVDFFLKVRERILSAVDWGGCFIYRVRVWVKVRRICFSRHTWNNWSSWLPCQQCIIIQTVKPLVLPDIFCTILETTKSLGQVSCQQLFDEILRVSLKKNVESSPFLPKSVDKFPLDHRQRKVAGLQASQK